MGLRVGEGVKGVERVDTYTFLLYTSHSRILRLSLTIQAGRTHFNPITTFLKPSQGWISRSSDILFSSTSSIDSGIIALGLGAEYHPGLGSKLIEGPEGGSVNGTPVGKGKERASILGASGAGGVEGRRREVWVLAVEEARGVLQGWTMDGKGQKLLKEIEVFEDIVQAMNTVEIKLIDIAVKKDGKIAVLVQYNPGGQGRSTAYAIAVINPSEDVIARVDHLVKLDYTSDANDEFENKAKLLVSHESELAFVHLSGALLTSSLQKGCFYQSTAELKEPSYNPFLATTFDTLSHAHRRDTQNANSTVSKVFALCASTGVLCIEADELKAEGYEAKSIEQAQVLSLRSRIEQSVQLGGHTNPLAFSWESSDAQFSEAILAVSNGITTSESSYHRTLSTMTYDLQDRLEKQFKLVAIINTQGDISRLSAEVKRSLAVDAEVLHAAADIRELLDQSERHGFWDSHIPLGLLGKGVVETMSQIDGLLNAEEAIHSFFESNLRVLPQVLLTVAGIATGHTQRLEQVATEDALVSLTDWTLEAARIFQIAFERAEHAYKTENLVTYGISQDDWARAPGWIVNAQMLSTFTNIYQQCVRVLQQRTAFYGVEVDEAVYGESHMASQQQQKQAELKRMVSAMAGPLISAIQEEAHTMLRQLAYNPDSPAGKEKRQQLLQDEHDVIIPLILTDCPLAWRLAEKWQVVETLAEMATRTDIGDADRIACYLEGDLGQGPKADLGKRFAKCLFDGYLAAGRYEAILQYSKKYSETVRKFLERKGRNDLLWLYYLTHNKPEEAGAKVQKAAEAVTDAHGNRALLSIAKLIKLATVPSESRNAELHDIDIHLGLHSTAENLRKRINTIIKTEKTHVRPLMAFMNSHCRRLGLEPDFVELRDYYEATCHKLLDHKWIDREEMIDLLTMKDMVDENDVNDFIVALKIVREWEEEGNDGARKVVCLRSIWRRLYSADDWANIISRNDGDADIESWLSYTNLYRVLMRFEGEVESDMYLTPSTAREPFPTNVQPRRYTAEPEFGARFMACLQKEGELLDEVEGLSDVIANEVVEKVTRELGGNEDDDGDATME